MKILHFADLHLDPVTAANTRPGLVELVRACERERPDLIVNAGDLSWRRGYLAPWVGLELREAHVAMSRIAPVIVVAGNHDLAVGGSSVGTVLGALGASAALRAMDDGVAGAPEPSLEQRLFMFERPAVFFSGNHLAVACLPYPSRHWLLAEEPGLSAAEVLPRLSARLAEELAKLAAQVGDRPAILIFHGSIAGARADSEQTMTTEMDVVLDEAAIPPCFGAVLCGHIHRHQAIGRAVYPSSPVPLRFSEEKGQHGYVVWETTHRAISCEIEGPWRWTFRPLPVAHPLVTVDRRARAGGGSFQLTRPVDGARFRELNALGDLDFAGAHVRAMCTVSRELSAAAVRAALAEHFEALGASRVAVVMERTEEARDATADPRAETSMESLIRLYVERRPELRGLAESLVLLAREAEALLPAEATAESRTAGYVLERLEWSNWKSYGEGNVLEMESLGRLVSIEGANATGKSNAAEVEAWALYGRFIRGRQTLGEAVRKGQREASVTALLTSSGGRWRIMRRIRVSKSGVGTGEVSLARWSDLNLTWEPQEGGSARETDRAIEALVGPFELYIATRFASQGEIDYLLDLAPAEWKETLQSLLSMGVFTARQAVASGLLDDARRAQLAHAAGLDAWQQEAALLDERRAAVAATGEAVASAREQASLAERGLRAAEQRLAQAIAENASIAARIKGWQDARARRDGLRAEVPRLEALIRTDDEQLLACAEAARQLADLPALRAELNALEAAAAKLGQHAAGAALYRERVAASERVLSEATRAHGQRVAGLENKHAQARRSFERAARERSERIEATMIDLNARRFSWETELTRLSCAEDLLAGTPFGARCIEAACPLVAGAVKDRDAMPDARARMNKEIRAREAALETLRAGQQGLQQDEEQRIPEARRELAGEQEVWSREREQLERALASCREQVLAHAAAAPATPDASRAAALPGLIRSREALAGRVAAASEVRGRMQASVEELVRLRERVARAEQEFDALGPQPEDASNLVELQHQMVALRETHERSRGEIENVLLALGQARANLERSQAAQGHLETAAADGLRLERRALLCSTYATAVGRDGLPYLMLERSLPALEAYANHFLCDDLCSGLAVEIDRLRELQGGGARSEVVVRYRNPMGTHSLAAASGMERTLLGYALRAALALLQAESQGTTVSHWIADEGWGVLDEEHLVTVGQPMLRRLAERFGRVFVISHQGPIREVCESRLVVEMDLDNGSSLKRVA